jgi:nucleoid DNA-binding protein
MATITKKALALRIAEKTGHQQTVTQQIIQLFIDEILYELSRGNRFEFRDFGVFEVKTRAPRTARNPRTGDEVKVPEKKIVSFKPGKLMKQIAQAETPVSPPEPRAIPKSHAPQPLGRLGSGALSPNGEEAAGDFGE